MDTASFKSTPTILVQDNRGLAIRQIQYNRHPDTPENTETLITRYQNNALGFLAHSIDPRLYQQRQTDNTVKPNFSYITSLSGEVLSVESVDAGMTVTMKDIAQRPHFAVNATSYRCHWQYEDSDSLGRLLSITEQQPGKESQISERFIWAGNSQAEKRLNLVGACIRHYDTAGLEQINSIALNGAMLSTARRLLQDNLVANWQGQDESDWDAQLTAAIYTNQYTRDATGAILTSTDAIGNRQRQAYDVAGMLMSSWLTLKSGREQVIVKSLTYAANGQKLREEHGNGIVTSYRYEPETQRLLNIKTERPTGHMAGAKILQDLRYDYDPVGNVLRITNDAEATRFWRNQKIVPENHYRYDSLYQLVQATGREMANIGQQTTQLPPASPIDSNTFANYSRTYTYDSGGNLSQIRHSAPTSNNNYTVNITVSNRTNRAVLSSLTEDPAMVDRLFTPGGQQQQLLSGQALTWTPRGELLTVTLVVHNDQPADLEWYRYDANSQRLVKTSVRQQSNTEQTQQVIYLTGAELRTTTNGNSVQELLEITTMGEAGRAQVRALHWTTGKPTEINNDQLRYSYDDQLGSSRLEVDENGLLISQEEYYPYGGTSVLLAVSQLEVNYKTIRYSGKELDASGLYYYGYRYYQPWVGRWLSADPAGTVDGLNLYRMVRNNPIVLKDIDGRFPDEDIPPPPPMKKKNPPPPPMMGGKNPPPLPIVAPVPNATMANTQRIFDPIILDIPIMPGNTVSPGWEVEQYVDIDLLASTISLLFGIEKKSISFMSVSHQEVFEQIKSVPENASMEFDSENLSANPSAWTSPKGIIYMGTTAPDFSSEGSLDVDKIRSTIIHESLHAVSHNHTGFQAETDMSATNSNYDEYVTDFFCGKSV